MQAWWNIIFCLHSNNPSWHYMVDFIVLETQDKLRVVMLAMNNINKYISSTCTYSTISPLIDIIFVLNS
jgi:hypothetical protein